MNGTPAMTTISSRRLAKPLFQRERGAAWATVSVMVCGHLGGERVHAPDQTPGARAVSRLGVRPRIGTSGRSRAMRMAVAPLSEKAAMALASMISATWPAAARRWRRRSDFSGFRPLSLAPGGARLVVLLGAGNDAVHRYAPSRRGYLPVALLGGEHHRVGPVEHRGGHVRKPRRGSASGSRSCSPSSGWRPSTGATVSRSGRRGSAPLLDQRHLPRPASPHPRSPRATMIASDRRMDLVDGLSARRASRSSTG